MKINKNDILISLKKDAKNNEITLNEQLMFEKYYENIEKMNLHETELSKEFAVEMSIINDINDHKITSFKDLVSHYMAAILKEKEEQPIYLRNKIILIINKPSFYSKLF